jgi:hypothetical protein
MEKSFGLFFHLKTSRNNKATELPIYLCITVNKVSREVSTKRKCDPLKWNTIAGRVDGKTQYAKSINDYLDVVERKVYEIRKQLFDNDQPVTAENIKTILHGKEIKGHDFYEDFVDFLSFEYVQRCRKNPIVGLKINTIGKTINRLRIFLKNRAKKR